MQREIQRFLEKQEKAREWPFGGYRDIGDQDTLNGARFLLRRFADQREPR